MQSKVSNGYGYGVRATVYILWLRSVSSKMVPEQHRDSEPSAQATLKTFLGALRPNGGGVTELSPFSPNRDSNRISFGIFRRFVRSGELAVWHLLQETLFRCPLEFGWGCLPVLLSEIIYRAVNKPWLLILMYPAPLPRAP